MNSPEIQEFIREQSHLFWYTPEDKKPEISHEFLVETILNYGDMEAVRKLFRLLGMEEISNIFYNLKGRKKLNYFPEVYNFLSLLVKQHAQRNPNP